MKYLKYIFVFVFSFLIITASVSAVAQADTVAGLRLALSNLKAKKNANEAKKAQTKSEISNAKNNIYSSQEEIKKNQKTVDDTKVEIESLNVEIAKTEESIKNLMSTYQASSGDNIYLDYLFNAKDYSDLVYRYTIVEQITSYNKEQIDSWSGKIEYNKQLQKDLAAKEIELNNQILEMEKNVNILGDKLAEYSEITMDLNDEINSTQDWINYLVQLGCKENEDITVCMSMNGDTGFSKPLTRGTITSYFGYRIHPITKKVNSFHGAIDIGGNKEGTAIYSTANGTVGKIIRKASCGGNSVYVYHNIAGKLYTSAYLHLLDINVKLGDKITRNTVVGTVGGGSKTPWDGCSTGAHLHFVIAKGWYGTSCSGDCYLSYSTYIAKAQDPQAILKLPNKGTYWSSR